MAKNIDHLQHIKSNIVVEGKPKLPPASGLVEGELAINYAEGYETISLKNSSGDIVTFSSDDYYTEQKLGSGFTGANSANTVTNALSNKQDILSAGTGIEISGNVISVTGGSSGIVDQVLDDTTSASTNAVSSKAVYKAVTDNELVWTNAYVTLSGAVSSHTVDNTIHFTTGTVQTQIDDSISGKTDTSAFTAHTADTTIHLTSSEKTNLHTHSNKSALDSITGNVGTMAYENTSSYSSATEVNTALGDKLDTTAYTPTTTVWEAGTGTNSAVLKGGNNVASGDYAVAEGYMTIASNSRSHAEGNSTSATSYNSHAEGHSTKANGYASHAEGYGTTAAGYASHAEGYNTSANTTYSHAEGYYTKTQNDYEHASGQYNISVSATTTFGNSGNTLFSVGNGTNNNSRHNAFEIRQNGDIYLNDGSILQSTLSGKVNTTDIVSSITSANSASTNAVSVGAVMTVIAEDERVTSSALNDLETNKLDVSAYTPTVELWVSGTGENSVAQKGGNNTASGILSVAEGNNTTASNFASHAEGYYTTASGNYGSHAEGSGTTASGSSSHAEGYNTLASGNYSHAEGYGTSATTGYAHSEGYNTLASGSSSHAEGDSTKANGYISHAEGYKTSATTSYSHAEGYYTTASGESSHAEGDNTIAGGNYSHAEGNSTKAGGNFSHAEGWGTSATTNYSHAEGYNTSTKNNAEHASGQYNISVSATTTFGNSGNTLFSVGNGTNNNSRHNAFEIRQNGDIYLNDGSMLQTTLSGKSNTGHTHTISDVTNLDIKVGVVSAVTVSSDLTNVTCPDSITGASNSGAQAIVIYENSGATTDYTITVTTSYKSPDGSQISITCPKNGYCEVSYLNINGTIYARGA